MRRLKFILPAIAALTFLFFFIREKNREQLLEFQGKVDCVILKEQATLYKDWHLFINSFEKNPSFSAAVKKEYGNRFQEYEKIQAPDQICQLPVNLTEIDAKFDNYFSNKMQDVKNHREELNQLEEKIKNDFENLKSSFSSFSADMRALCQKKDRLALIKEQNTALIKQCQIKRKLKNRKNTPTKISKSDGCDIIPSFVRKKFETANKEIIEETKKLEKKWPYFGVEILKFQKLCHKEKEWKMFD